MNRSKIAMLVTASCVCVVSMLFGSSALASASANASPPQSDLTFVLPKGVVAHYDAYAKQLTVSRNGELYATVAEAAGRNRTVFTARLFDGELREAAFTVSTVNGLVSKFDFTFITENGAKLPPGQMSQLNGPNPTVFVTQTCDCTDGINTNCTTTGCNAGTKCPQNPTSAKATCKWKSSMQVAVIDPGVFIFPGASADTDS